MLASSCSLQECPISTWLFFAAEKYNAVTPLQQGRHDFNFSFGQREWANFCQLRSCRPPRPPQASSDLPTAPLAYSCVGGRESLNFSNIARKWVSPSSAARRLDSSSSSSTSSSSPSTWRLLGCLRCCKCWKPAENCAREMNLGDFFVEVMHSCHELAIQPALQLLLLCCLEVPCHNLGPSILQHTGNVDRDNDYERGQRHRIHMRTFSLGCVFTTLNAQPIEAQLLPTSIGSPPFTQPDMNALTEQVKTNRNSQNKQPWHKQRCAQNFNWMHVEMSHCSFFESWYSMQLQFNRASCATPATLSWGRHQHLPRNAFSTQTVQSCCSCCGSTTLWPWRVIHHHVYASQVMLH